MYNNELFILNYVNNLILMHLYQPLSLLYLNLAEMH